MNRSWDFPGGPVIKNLPSNTGDMGSIPGLGRSHMPLGRLSLCATTPEAPSLEPVLHNKRSHLNE